mgnify:FL=1
MTETTQINFRMELYFSIPLTGELLGQFYNWITETGLYSPSTWDNDKPNWENINLNNGIWEISSTMEIPLDLDESNHERKQKIGKFLAWEMEDNQNKLYYELNEMSIG